MIHIIDFKFLTIFEYLKDFRRKVIFLDDFMGQWKNCGNYYPWNDQNLFIFFVFEGGRSC